MRHRLTILLACLLFSTAMHAQTPVRKQIGVTGAWKNTLFARGMGSAVYSIESSGALTATNPETTAWVRIGSQSYINTTHLFAGSKNIFTIEKDGSLYKTNPSTGDWSRVGDAGAYVGTITGVITSGYLYTISVTGSLIVTNVNTGIKQALGKAVFKTTRLIFDANGKLYSIDTNGNLWETSQADGSTKQIGGAGAWKQAITATNLWGKLYTAESDGSLYVTELSTGSRTMLSATGYGQTKMMLSASGKVYVIDTTGTMVELTL